MELDFRQLCYLLAISQEGSFTRAAARLKMFQPTLSNAIAQLERRIESTVLTRGRQGARLTELSIQIKDARNRFQIDRETIQRASGSRRETK